MTGDPFNRPPQWPPPGASPIVSPPARRRPRLMVAAAVAGAGVVAGAILLSVSSSGGSDSSPSSTSRALPSLSIDGCPEATAGEIDAVNRALVSGLEIAGATAAADVDGVRYIVASIYDGTASRVSSTDTWAVVDGDLHALSSSALEYSQLPDGRDVLTGFDQGFGSELRDDLEQCALAASLGQPRPASFDDAPLPTATPAVPAAVETTAVRGVLLAAGDFTGGWQVCSGTGPNRALVAGATVSLVDVGGVELGDGQAAHLTARDLAADDAWLAGAAELARASAYGACVLWFVVDVPSGSTPARVLLAGEDVDPRRLEVTLLDAGGQSIDLPDMVPVGVVPATSTSTVPPPVEPAIEGYGSTPAETAPLLPAVPPPPQEEYTVVVTAITTVPRPAPVQCAPGDMQIKSDGVTIGCAPQPRFEYENCAAARAAGAAPVYRGDPGYGAHLDRDGDGIGCET